MADRPIINYTPELLAKLKRQYRHAVEVGQDQFVFEGHDILVAYAKYLIEYLDGRFGKAR